ncbi:Pycsar system effector family protein [Streptomyces uncialis]|uniref:Pycsar system effector family protein n=1 Tax=Streptomyces uncialis TaxID=1048205 RepID=UPI003867A71A|nr:DUF5706 domain-containing protein [Streptomyces uncialis]
MTTHHTDPTPALPPADPAPANAVMPDRTDQNLTEAVAAAATEVGRTDGKASLLLAFNGAVIAALAGAGGGQLPLATRITGALAVVTLAASAVLLLLVVRPHLSGADRASFPHWARRTPAQIRAEMKEDRRPDKIHVLSRIAQRKYRHYRNAIDLTLAAITLIVTAVLTTL